MISRTPLDDGTDHRRDLYLTAHNTHNAQTSMSLEGFETAISTNGWPQTHTLYHVAIGISRSFSYSDKFDICFWCSIINFV